MTDAITFPIYLTLEEMRKLITDGQPESIWHKLNNAISIMETGEICCEEMSTR